MSALTPIVPFPPIPPSNLQRADSALGAAALAAVQLPSSPPPSPYSHPNKEAAPVSFDKPLPAPEATRLVEVQETEPLPAEVEGWLQKLDQEGDIQLDKPLTHDGDILLSDTEAQVVKEKIVLPLTQSGSQQALTKKVTESARWLAEWCLRLIKMMKDKVKYAPEQIRSN